MILEISCHTLDYQTTIVNFHLVSPYVVLTLELIQLEQIENPKLVLKNRN